MIDTRLRGRVAVVTGANNPRGIGAAIARALAAQGARLFLHGCRPAGAPAEAASVSGEAFYHALQFRPLSEAIAALRDAGAEADGWEADLADPATVPSLFDRAEAALGPVEVLVNNAAYWEADTFVPAQGDLPNKAVEMWTARPQPIHPGSIDRILAVDTRAVALLMAEFARRHAARGARWGRIVNISTDGAARFPSEVSYGAAKYAVESYTRSAAAELGQYGITVNVLSLGPIQTGWITPELERAIVPGIPLGRLGTPEDVADVVVFLASDQARWLTGQRIRVGGGNAM